MGSAHVVHSDLAGQLRLSTVRLSRRLRAQRTAENVTLAQLSAMHTLYRHTSLTPSELAASERIQPPSMTRVITGLERAGLISRRVDPKDRRHAILELTAAGRDLLAADAAVTERWLDRRLSELTDEERDTLAEAIEIIDRMTDT